LLIKPTPKHVCYHSHNFWQREQGVALAQGGEGAAPHSIAKVKKKAAYNLEKMEKKEIQYMVQ
jgi:hypothetical protein